MDESGTSTGGDSLCPESIVKHFKEVYPVEKWKKNGFFEESDMLDIPCHWMEFEPPRSSVHFILAFICIIVFLVGFFSNSLVIYIMSSSKKPLTPTNILLTNLAVSDLLTVLMIPVFIFNSFLQGPAIGKLGCSLYGFLTGLSGTCSIMSLTAVAVERYFVISLPLTMGGKPPTRNWAYLMSLSTWFYSAVFASLPFFGVGKYVPEGYLTSCCFDFLSDNLETRIFILIFFFGAWVIPMIIILYSYSAIFHAVVHVRRNAPHDTHSSSYRTKNSTGINQPNVEMKIAKTIMGLIGTWTVSWTPYAVVALIGISGHSHLLTPLSAMIPALFAKSSTCINPFINILTQPLIHIDIWRRLKLISPTFTSTSESVGTHTSSFNGDIDLSAQQYQPITDLRRLIMTQSLHIGNDDVINNRTSTMGANNIITDDLIALAVYYEVHDTMEIPIFHHHQLAMDDFFKEFKESQMNDRQGTMNVYETVV